MEHTLLLLLKQRSDVGIFIEMTAKLLVDSFPHPVARLLQTLAFKISILFHKSETKFARFANCIKIGVKMDEKDSINKYREKKKRRARGFKAAVLFLVLLIVLLMALNWNALVEPFKDIFRQHGEGGFPVALPGSTQYTLGELGDNFFLLTDTYLYTYDKNGAEMAGVQHGFRDPASSANDRRLIVYDVNGTSFKMYSRNGEVYQTTLEDSIVFGQMGSTDRCAVVTTSTRYFNYLYVFNSEGKQIFRWSSPDEKIMNICFGQNDNTIYVSTIGERNGMLNGSLVKFDLANGESEIWRTELGDKLTYSVERCTDGIYIVSSSGAFLVDENSGEILCSNQFTKNVRGIPKVNGIRCVIFRDTTSNRETIVIYNKDLEAINSMTFEDSITAFDTDSGLLYILSGQVLTMFDESLNEIKRLELDDEYSDFKIMDGKAYLLGYNSVQRQDF